jgi:hypothetical protein
MKTLTKIILFVSVILQVNSQDLSGIDLFINNVSSRQMTFRIYPISVVFNGFGNYDLKGEQNTDFFHFINGRNKYSDFFNVVAINGATGLNFDGGTDVAGSIANVGKGWPYPEKLDS